jgi:hypothetical protein
MQAQTFQFLRELASDGVTLRVRGGCMAPLLADGAAVTVQRRRVYLPGDVVVFRTPAGELAAHRVLGWRAGGLVTQGDRCDVHDAPVARGAVVGAVAGLRVGLRARVRALARMAALVCRRAMRRRARR